MASTNSDDSEFLRFSTLRDFQRQAIILRSGGKTWDEVAAAINQQYDLSYARDTIRQWFLPGQPLEAAYDEYNDMLADQSLKNAKKLARRGAEAAITKMVTLMGDAYDPGLQLRAAIALANKYVPDRQIVGTELGESDLPPELLARGDEIVETDDAPEGTANVSGVGGDTGEGLSAPVLQQPAEADRPSDSPA